MIQGGRTMVTGVHVAQRSHPRLFSFDIFPGKADGADGAFFINRDVAAIAINQAAAYIDGMPV